MRSWIIAGLVKLLLGPSISYAAPLDPARPRVFFANHSSHLDFLVIWACLPPKQRRITRPVAARDYWQSGPLRRIIAGSLFGAVMIERKGASDEQNPVEQMIEVLDSGASLIIFPEGTRGAGDVIAPFRSGIYQLNASRPDVELVPVHLENLNRVLPKGEFVPVPLLSRVTFGAPLPAIAGEDRSPFLARARRAVIDLESDPS
jgi:1-acyl-sn-glycerol-3-phosphate acyltransferase